MKDKTVLVVDFDERSIEPLSQFLKDEGFGVLVARDGEEGLEMAKKETPDLVVLEPMLPKLHGFELCGIITHDLEPKIPVIILTKFYREEQFKIESVRSFGASAFVSKPFKKPEMGKLIRELLPAEPEDDEEQELKKEEINGPAIPDATPAEAIKELQEEEPSEKPQKPDAKKDRDFGQELDDMLEDAFADLGLVGGEKNAPPLNGKSPDEDIKPDALDAAVKEPEAQAPAAMPADPMLKVEELLSPKPEKKAPPQDDILQKIDELARGTRNNPKADASQATEEGKESPEKILQMADAVTETLEKELETKVKEMSARENEKTKVKEKTNSKRNSKEKARKETVQKSAETKPEPEPEPVLEKVEPAVIEKAEPAAEEKVEPAAVQKTEKPPEKPDLKDVVASEGMFSGFGPDEEVKSGSNPIKSLIAKIKGAPKKIILPMAALALVVVVAAVFMIPKMSKDAPVEQATLGANTMAQSLPASSQGEEAEKPAVDPGEDPNGIDNPAESGTVEENPSAQPPREGTTEQPAQKPAEKPEQKPEVKSTPPPTPAPAVEDIAESQVSSELAGNITPSQTTLENPVPNQKPPQKNEERTGTISGSDPNREAAGPPAEKAASEPEQPGNKAPARVSMGDIVSIKQVDTEPELIQQEMPRFPAAAKGRGVAGTVMLNTLISENGDVLQTVVIRKIDGPYGFNEAAERAVKKWKFRPAWKDGVRVKVWKVLTIAFKENMD